MILHALKEYYERKSADSSNENMAPIGWQWKEIPFVLVLDKAGKLVSIDDHRDPDKGKNRAKAFLVPQEGGRTSDVKANILWDKPSYIWGYSKGAKKSPDRKRKQAFLDTIKNLKSDDVRIQSVITYLSSHNALEQAQYFSEAWKAIEGEKKEPFIGIRFDGDLGLICEYPQVKESINLINQKKVYVDNQKVDVDLYGTCLVTGAYHYPQVFP